MREVERKDGDELSESKREDSPDGCNTKDGQIDKNDRWNRAVRMQETFKEVKES